MAAIPDKIAEIERNIQEGEMMLIVLRRLPESEETRASINRFEELVQKLEEYRDRYKSFESMPVNDLDSQLEALREKHGRIRMLLEESTTLTQGESAPSSSHAMVLGPQDEPALSPTPQHTRHDSDADINEADLIAAPNSEDVDPPPNGSDSDIDPSEWLVHYQAQTCQLSHMLSQTERFQEMATQLNEIVSGLDMVQAVGLLNDITQRFDEVKSSLLSLQKAYQGLYNHEDVSAEFKASQLKNLRDFLITLGRQLEVTKDCFFSVAEIVKKLLGRQPAEDNDERAEGRDKAGQGAAPRDDDEAEVEASAVAKEGVAAAAAAAEQAAHAQKQLGMQEALADLCRQRDELLHQLAEVRAKTYDNISASNEKFHDISKLFATAQTTSAAPPQSSVQPVSGTADVGDDVDDPNKSTLPILKRLQARKDHLEELRGELRAFTFVNGDGEPARSSSSSGVATRSAPPRPRTAPRVGPSQPVAVAINVDIEQMGNSPPQRPSSEPPNQNCGNEQQLGQSTPPSSGCTESDGIAPRSEVVTFQEPEATYLDNTERLYKRMREARIWREEHRQPDGGVVAATSSTPVAMNDINRASGDKISTMSNFGSAGGGSCVGLRSSTSAILRGLQTGASADTASGMDATAMATWGGDSEAALEVDEPENQEDAGEGGYLEDVAMVPSVVSSAKSGGANNSKRLVTVDSSCSGTPGMLSGSTPQDNHLSAGRMVSNQPSVSLPQLGHSPSPDQSGAHRRVSRHRHIRPGRPDITFNADETGEFSLTKQLATRLTGLEFKVEQLSQTCQLLVIENARLNSTIALLLAAGRQQQQAQPPPQLLSCPVVTTPADWSFSSINNYQQPAAAATASMLLHSNSVNGVSSVQSLLPAPPTPVMMPQPSPAPPPSMVPAIQQPLQAPPHNHVSPSLERALEHVQMLTAQVMEQHSRVNNLQNELHFALQSHHNHQQQQLSPQQQQMVYASTSQQQPLPSSEPPLNFPERLQRLKVAQLERAFRDLFKLDPGQLSDPRRQSVASTSFVTSAPPTPAVAASSMLVNRQHQQQPISTWQPQLQTFCFDAPPAGSGAYFPSQNPQPPQHE